MHKGRKGKKNNCMRTIRNDKERDILYRVHKEGTRKNG
jgi:hypothetical protein